MDTILITVTGLALALAAGMGVLLARMRREERRRSEARVAMLANAAVRSRDLELRPASSSAPVSSDLFREHEEGSAWPKRLGVITAIAAALVILALGWRAIAPAAPAPSTPAVSSAPAPPLELLSLGHDQHDGTLTISGIVQNPRGGVSLGRVQATVLVFGRDGALLANAREPLENSRLTPGTESPFVIQLPLGNAAARYRVGFRDENDGALGHVDRRDPNAVAGKEVP